MIDRISDAYKAAAENRGDPVQISEECYYEALEVLPPVYGKNTQTSAGRFWVGEAYDFDAKGRQTSLECYYTPKGIEPKRFYCRITAIESNRQPAL